MRTVPDHSSLPTKTVVRHLDSLRAACTQRAAAAFHLDELASSGLVDVRYLRTSGRTGPGAGRPSKLNGRVSVETSVSLPARRDFLAADPLASAVDESAGRRDVRLLKGITSEPDPDANVRLQPEPDVCCVRITPSRKRAKR